MSSLANPLSIILLVARAGCAPDVGLEELVVNWRGRVREVVGEDADITGWSYRVLLPDSSRSAVEAVAGTISDRGNLRMLFIVGLDELDPVADDDALQVLREAPWGSRLAYEVAFFVRGLPF